MKNKNKMSNVNIGAHKSAAGGFAKALERVDDIGGTCLQIFSSSPRIWRGPSLSDKEVKKFKERKKELGIDPVIFHAPYLINLADRGSTGEKSIEALIDELTAASRCGIMGSVIHVGSYKTDDGIPEDDDHYDHLIAGINEVLESTPEDSLFIIENMGTRKIGKELDQIGQIIQDVGGSDRLKVCLDTCHLHAAGYSLQTLEEFKEFFTTFDEQIGTDRLAVIHANDSRDEAGSLRDRHENIGEGNVPKEMFVNLLTKEPTADLPFIIETPGFDSKGPDAKNINRLKQLAE